jgi:hypothetical protein
LTARKQAGFRGLPNFENCELKNRQRSC